METLNIATIAASYPVKSLSAFKSVELESNQYLVRKIEKGTGLDSKGAIIPAVTAEEATQALEQDTIFSAMVEWYQGLIAEVCKGRIAAGATTLVPADYSVGEVVAYLQEKEVSEGRVSKERIAAWFSATVESPLKSAFKAKLGASISDEKLAEVLASYKNAFSLLAKRELVLDAGVQANLEKALALVAVEKGGAMRSYCETKLKLAAQKSADMLAL